MAKKKQPKPAVVDELEDDPGRDPDEVFAHEDDVPPVAHDDEEPDESELKDDSDLEDEDAPAPAAVTPASEPSNGSRLDEPVVDTAGEQELTPENRSDCLLVVINSHDYLRREKGWTTAEIITFLDRPEVRREIRSLEESFKSRTTIQERQQFFAQSKINNMVPGALALLQRTLLGDREVNGQVVRSPSRQQYDAAMEVLKRSNVQGSKFTVANGSSVLDNVDSAAGGALSKIRKLKPEDRDGVRRTISAMARRLQAMQAAKHQQDAAIHAPEADSA